MNHSFNVEVAVKYGVEKAVMLENIAFWVLKNRANKKNIHNGKAYTYNTADAFAELFPYIKPRKIAQLLREMESDGLIISGQFDGTKRTKSYTITNFAWNMLSPNLQDSVSSNIQKSDDGISENLTMDYQESVCCLNTDINTDIKPNINIVAEATRPKKAPLVDREPVNDIERVEKAYLLNYRELYKSGIVRTEKPIINWGQARKRTKDLLAQYGLEIILKAVENSRESDFCIQNGYSLNTIFSSGVLSGLINGNTHRKGHLIEQFDKVETSFVPF